MLGNIFPPHSPPPLPPALYHSYSLFIYYISMINLCLLTSGSTAMPPPLPRPRPRPAGTETPLSASQFIIKKYTIHSYNSMQCTLLPNK